MKHFDCEVTYVIGGIVDKSRSIKTKNLWYDAPSQKIESEKDFNPKLLHDAISDSGGKRNNINIRSFANSILVFKGSE